MEISDRLCSTAALHLGKEPQTPTEKEMGGAKTVRDLRNLHGGVAKICDMGVPVLAVHLQVHCKGLVLFGCVK
jgi:hypothetical protein